MEKNQPEWISVLFLGLKGAGKTTLLHRLKTASFQPDFHKGLYHDGFMHGGIHYRAMDLEHSTLDWKLYTPWAHALICVVDMSNQESVEKTSELLPEIVKHISKGTVFFILGNKSDAETALSVSTLIDRLQLSEILNMTSIGIQIFPLSSKTGEGLSQAVDWLISGLLDLYTTKLGIYDVYVYRADSGLPIGHVQLSSTEEQPENVTSLITAIDAFAKQKHSGGIKSFKVDFPDGKTRQLVKIQREMISVLLVCGPEDPIPLAQEVGSNILDYVEKRPELLDDLNPYNLLSSIEIIQRVRPFLAEEAISNLQKVGYSPEYKENSAYKPETPLIEIIQDRLSFLHRSI